MNKGVNAVPFRKIGKKARPAAALEVPVLCRFWQEDDVWNASAVDLPIAVFGASIEEAQDNMRDALVAHLEGLQKLGDLEKTIEYLRTLARDRTVKTCDMAQNQLFMRLSAAVQDQHVVALV